MENLILVRLDSQYCNYLRQFDKKCLNKTEEKYIQMLKEQIFWLNRNNHKLYDRSKKLYDKYLNGTLNKALLKDVVILNY